MNIDQASSNLLEQYALEERIQGIGIGVNEEDVPCIRVAVHGDTSSVDLPAEYEGYEVLVFDISEKPLPNNQHPQSDLRLHLLSVHGIDYALRMDPEDALRRHDEEHMTPWSDDHDYDDLGWNYSEAQRVLDQAREMSNGTWDTEAVLQNYISYN